MTKEEFIAKASEKHKNKYDYSKVEYVNSQTLVDIICPEHGEFKQRPNAHLRGQGCPKCKTEAGKRLCSDTTETFIKKANGVHGDKYDYSMVEYVNTNTLVKIICPKHGEFEQKPNVHLQGKGCPRCGIEKTHTVMTTDDFIKKAKTVHGNKYDYSRSEYKSPFEPLVIICPQHGEFKQKASYHLSGNGCPLCGLNKVAKTLSLDSDTFIEKAKKIHGNKYDYSKVDYINNKTDVIITCPIHGDFKVKPFNHLYNKSGCPRCSTSKLEEKLCLFLKEKNISFDRQVSFDWLKNDLTNYKMKYDVFIPSLSLAIECQGQQHFFSGGIYDEQMVSSTIHRDTVKNRLSMENSIQLIYYIPAEFKKYALESSLYNDNNMFFNLEDLTQFLKNI